jgi:hypothetical protein
MGELAGGYGALFASPAAEDEADARILHVA